ncbi:MAG: flagellar hook protein FlgE [Nevskiales bacterium]
MSLFGALNTAVSGLSAQSAAFGNISDNVANSQTTGYKAVNTGFVDYLTTSTATSNQPGSVSALPAYTNNVQGTISQSSDPLAMAISGQGFFAVSEAAGVSTTGQPNFSAQTYYTQAGDFQLNQSAYLVNGEGEYLQGWAVNPLTDIANQSQLAPIQITQTQFNPVPTANINLSANLPATPAAGTPVSSQIDVFDALGNSHTLTLDWTQSGANDWTVTISSPDANPSTVIGTAEVQFGAASPNGTNAGTIGAFGVLTGSVAATSYAPNSPASLTLSTDFGSGNQNINLNMGDFGEASGVTQFAGTTYTQGSLSQDGVAPGAFTGISITQAGDVVANYNNGETQTVAQVPITTFASPDSLQRQNGQAFTATTGSGNPITQAENTNGAGNLIVGSIESSNVDIATQFSSLIVAQQAYGANAKVVTTADQLLQTTINMIQ